MFANTSLFFYPVRKPQHLCWGWWKYLQKQEHHLLIEGRVKALPFLTWFTLRYLFRQYGCQRPSFRVRRVVLSVG